MKHIHTYYMVLSRSKYKPTFSILSLIFCYRDAYYTRIKNKTLLGRVMVREADVVRLGPSTASPISAVHFHPRQCRLPTNPESQNDPWLPLPKRVCF